MRVESNNPQAGLLDPCTVRKWDAVLTTSSDIVYFMKGDYYFRLSGSVYDARQAHHIRHTWPLIQTPVDAAVTDKHGWSRIFKDDKFWYLRDEGYYEEATRISRNYLWVNWPRFDAGFYWPRNRHVYFIYGSWIWEETASRHAAPRLLNNMWSGLPPHIDAVFEVKRTGNVYFISGDNFYTYDPKYHGIKDSQPRSVVRQIFGCEKYIGQHYDPRSDTLEYSRIAHAGRAANLVLSDRNPAPVRTNVVDDFYNFSLKTTYSYLSIVLSLLVSSVCLALV